jgi:hypothetical protein
VICELCFDARACAERGGRRVCKSCREWFDHWEGLTPREQEGEIESMWRYVEEREAEAH